MSLQPTDLLHDAARAVTSVGRQVVNLFQEAGHRALSAPATLADVFGTGRAMTLRLRVVILRDEQDRPVASPAEVEPSIRDAQAIFRRDANIRIVPCDEQFIQLAPSAAPAEALDVRCGAKAYTADLGTAGHYFTTHHAATIRATETPLTVYIVRSMAGANGCALGPIADYATVSVRGLRARDDACVAGSPRTAHRVLAHELGHMCGLVHSKNCQDLMYRSAGQRFTTRTQVLTIRNSRFVASQ